jgi:hypothetical protein
MRDQPDLNGDLGPPGLIDDCGCPTGHTRADVDGCPQASAAPKCYSAALLRSEDSRAETYW